MFLGTWLPSTVSFPGFFFQFALLHPIEVPSIYVTKLQEDFRTLRKPAASGKSKGSAPSEGVFFLKAIG